MSSPIYGICSKYKIPNELRNKIQSYMMHDMTYVCLNEYMDVVCEFQDFYDDFVMETYITTNCYCPLYPSKRECSHCYIFEYSNYYKTSNFIHFIDENPQFGKIIQYKINNR